MRISYFISPHGFGHAARSCAVMASLMERRASLHFHIYTTVPGWFFEDSLPTGSFTYHPLETDIGMVQDSPLVEDPQKTYQRLASFVPFDPDLVTHLAGELAHLECRAVVCDIAPLGIAAAAAAGLPSLLVENFTWDWIYRNYFDAEPRLSEVAAYLQGWFQQAGFHLRTEPAAHSGPSPDLVVGPIARSPRQSRTSTRASLGIPAEDTVILLTLGGLSERVRPIEHRVPTLDACWWLIPGGSNQVENRGKQILLPYHSTYYHPDLVAASDAVIGKPGYSTVAEAYLAGIPFGYLNRPKFRESGVLAAFIQENLGGFEIPITDFETGTFTRAVPQLLEARIPRRSSVPDGPETASEAILDFLDAF